MERAAEEETHVLRGSLIAVVVIAAMVAIAGYLVGALLAGIRQRSEGVQPVRMGLAAHCHLNVKADLERERASLARPPPALAGRAPLGFPGYFALKAAAAFDGARGR